MCLAQFHEKKIPYLVVCLEVWKARGVKVMTGKRGEGTKNNYTFSLFGYSKN